MDEPLPRKDYETMEVEQQGNELDLMTKSAGWARARELLVARIGELGNILDIKPDEKGDIIQELKSRQHAINLILTWFKDIDSEVQQYHNHKTVLAQYEERGYIERREE